MTWLSGWAKRSKITIDSGDVSANLTHFPVTLFLSATCGKAGAYDLTRVFDEVGANYKKIAVTQDDGTTQLYVEVDEWDSGAETAILHVSRAGWVIDASGDTDFYVYYDGSHADNDAFVGLSNSTPAENVWNGNYAVVIHMKDDPDTSNVRDSTGNDNDGAKKGANEPIEAPGKIGDSQQYDHSDDVITVTHNATINLNATMTLEVWAKKTFADTRGFVLKGANFFVPNLWGITYLVSPVADMVYYLNGDTGLQYALFNTGAGTFDWTFFVAIRDNGTMKSYKNNVLQESKDSSGVGDVSNTDNLLIGQGRWVIGGLVDEFRLSNNVRPPEWFKATYESTRDDFLSFGSEELQPVTPTIGVYPLPPIPERIKFVEDHIINVFFRRFIDAGVLASLDVATNEMIALQTRQLRRTFGRFDAEDCAEAVGIIELISQLFPSEAKLRIPLNVSPDKTFFGHGDRWTFHSVLDDRICMICIDKHYPSGLYMGSHLRQHFPELEILDNNRVKANLHPNCRCWIGRLTYGIDPRLVYPSEYYPPIGYDPNFPKDKLKDPEKVLRIYKSVLEDVPEKDLEKLSQVLIHDFPETERGNTRGLFRRLKDVEEHEILVDPEAARERTIVVKRVMYHEIGHNVWYNLKAEEWAEWAAIASYHHESLPTDYARTKVTEAWAECYMQYRMNRLAPGKRFKRKYARAYRQDLHDRFEAILKRYESEDYAFPIDTTKERARKANELRRQGYKSIRWSDIKIE